MATHCGELEGVTVCRHWFHDVHAHLVASTPNARYMEFSTIKFSTFAV